MKDLNLIRKVAWSFNKTTGIEFDELFSEASLAYVEACKSHDEKKASLSTWATRIMTQRLTHFCDKEKRNHHDPLQEGDTISHENQEKRSLFKEWITELPKDMQLICQIIFEAPEEILASCPKTSRSKLTKKLRTMQWSWPRIWDGIRNMKSALNEN